MRKHNIILFFIVMLLVALMLIYLGYLMYDGIEDFQTDFRRKIADLLLQLSLVVVVGGAIKVLMDWGAKINGRFQARRERKIDFLRRVREVSVQVNYAQDLLNAHNSGKTYGERLRQILLIRGEIAEIIEDLKADNGLFEEQDVIETALLEMNDYLDGGRKEYIKHHNEAGVDAVKGLKIQHTIERLGMSWVSDFMAGGALFTAGFYDKLLLSKGKMREQVHGK